MAFKIKRGLVLRTNKALKVKGVSIATGTRVKAMSTIDKDTLKVKVKDARYPKLAGEHMTMRYDNVTKVERGRPEAVVAPKATKKAPAKKAKSTSPIAALPSAASAA